MSRLVNSEERTNLRRTHQESQATDIIPEWEPLVIRRRPRGSTITKFKGTKLFITYPQNDIDKDELISRVKLQWPNKVEWIVACNENHEPTEDDPNGGPHAHMIYKFKKQEWLYHDVLDNIGGKHGDYQCMKGTMLQACEYIIKHGVYSVWGIPNFEKYLSTLRKRQNPTNAIIAQEITDGRNLRDIAQDPEYKGFVMMNMQKIKYYYAHIQKWNAEPKQILGLYDKLYPELSIANRDLFDMIEFNLTNPRKNRQKHAWVLAKTSTGKSQLGYQLMHRYKVWIAGTTDPLDGYENNYYDIILIDEPNVGQYKLNEFNKILQGGVVSIRQRFVDGFKTDNPFIIITTNYTPDEFYPNQSAIYPRTDTYEAFLDRWETFEFTPDDPIRIWSDTY